MENDREKTPGAPLAWLRPTFLPASVKALLPTLTPVLLKLRYIGSCVCAGIGPVSAGVGWYGADSVCKILKPQLNSGGCSVCNSAFIEDSEACVISGAQTGRARVEKARRSLATARNLEVGGSGGNGRRQLAARRDGRAGPLTAVAVAVEGRRGWL
jgi:hypothetical protein